MPSTDPSIWSIVSSLGSLLGVLGVAFAVGYNWRRVTVLEQAWERHLTASDQRVAAFEVTYVRKEILDLELKAIRSRLDLLFKQWEHVSEQLAMRTNATGLP